MVVPSNPPTLAAFQGMDLIRQLAFDPTRGKLHPAGSIRSGGADRAALGPRYNINDKMFFLMNLP